MDLLPTGSNKILEVQSGNIYVVIKSKNSNPKIINKDILKQPSNMIVTGVDIRNIRILGDEKANLDNDGVSASSFNIHTHPLFFEQTDYEIIIKSNDGKSVSVWHENYGIRGKIGPVTDSDDLLTGIINFGNSAGLSCFEIKCDSKKVMNLQIEVFPSKISYKEDYQAMLQDISNEVYGAVLDFMKKTHQEFSIGSTRSNIPALFFEIIKKIFSKFQNAANTITTYPHHKLYVEHPVVSAHKIKKSDKHTLKWLQNHPENIIQTSQGYSVVKAPTVKKQITYNTLENQFAKYILKSTIQKLKDFKDRYEKSTPKPDKEITDSVDMMMSTVNKLIHTSFLKNVDEYKTTQSMSLVFEMAPGYRELYKYYLMMQRGLSMHGDVFRMSLKDTAQLYEYWCFIKLVTLMKKNYKLVSSDVIRVDNSGVTISLVKGRKSEVKFVNPRTGEVIRLAYNPGEQNTQTVNQKPDNVLTLEKRGTDVEYKYVFDAKYRIENNPSDPFYPDNLPGPKVDDINTMHRYRDSIVYENRGSSRFMFEKTMFGAYVLFPYNDPDGEYKNHRFYKSIDTVNIGGIPFLPGTTALLEDLLSELIADSAESAFERASLPRGIEEKLAKVDWTYKDVMVGTVRTNEQLRYSMSTKAYYAPVKYISEDNLPIRYIALYEHNINTESGIKMFGEVLTAQKVRRGKIPVSMRNGADPDELYYYFTVRNWIKLGRPIALQDSHKGRPQFTNKFLLDNCTKSYQLFSISSEEEYRLMVEINDAFDELNASMKDSTPVYRINDKSVFTSDGYFVIANDTGDIIDRVLISNFAEKPRVTFNKIKKIIG